MLVTIIWLSAQNTIVEKILIWPPPIIVNLFVSSERMIKLVTWQFCGRCHTLQPILEQYCKNNNLELEVIDVNEATPEELGDATMLPIIIRNGKHMDYDETLQKITQ